MRASARIYERLGAPTARQLYAAAVRENLEVSRQQTAAFVERQAEQQTFKAPPTSQGQTVAREKKSDMQADIIDMKTQKSRNFTAILLVINVWSREVVLEPLQRKTPQAVTGAFRKILQRMDKPAALSTDMGNEFRTEFNTFLEQQTIVHKYKNPKQLNSLAVLDRATQSIKKQMFQRMSRKNRTQWHLILKAIEDGYNETVINTLGGAPDDLEGNRTTSCSFNSSKTTRGPSNTTTTC